MADKQPFLNNLTSPHNGPIINIIDDPNIPNNLRTPSGLYNTSNNDNNVRRLSGQLNTSHIRSGSKQIAVSPISPTYNQLSSNNTPNTYNGISRPHLTTFSPTSPMGVKPHLPSGPYRPEYDNMAVNVNTDLLLTPSGNRNRSSSQISMNSPLKFNDPNKNRRTESDFNNVYVTKLPSTHQRSATMTEAQSNELLFSPNGQPSVSATMPAHFKKLAGEAIQQSPVVVVSPPVPAPIVYPVFTPQQLEGVKLYDDGKLEFPNGQLLLVSSESGLITSLDTSQIYGILPNVLLNTFRERKYEIMKLQAEDEDRIRKECEYKEKIRIPNWSEGRKKEDNFKILKEMLYFPAIVLDAAHVKKHKTLQMNRQNTASDFIEDVPVQKYDEPAPVGNESVEQYFSEIEKIDTNVPIDHAVFEEIPFIPGETKECQAIDSDRSNCMFRTDFAPSRFTCRRPRPYSSIQPQELFADNELFIQQFVRGVLNLNLDQFIYVMLDGINKYLDHNSLKNLGKCLSLLRNTEVLIIRDSGLTSLPYLALPHLLQLDVSHNKFTEVDSINELIENCPFLQQINLLNNPISADDDYWPKPDYLPIAKNEIWNVFSNFDYLEVINNKIIPNSLRTKAFKIYASAGRNSLCSEINCAMAFNHIPQIIEMNSWYPMHIEKLDLSGQGLHYIHAGSLRALQVLNLGNNFISTLENMGLEQCVHLERLSLKNNLLSKKDNYSCLNPLKFLFNLTELWMTGNKGLGDTYESYTIYLLRHIDVNLNYPGLMYLNGKFISIEERVKAVSVNDAPRYEHSERWKLNLIALIGSRLFYQGPHCFSKIKKLVLSNCNLKRVDMTEYPSLQYLDLSNNKLENIYGFDKLYELKILNVSMNTLKLDTYLSPLKDVSRLENVSMLKPDHEVDFKFIRRIVVGLSKSTKLAVIDGVIIDKPARLRILKDYYNPPLSGKDLDSYSLNLALAEAATPFIGRDYSSVVINSRSQVNNINVKNLNLSHLSLTHEFLENSAGVSLSSFTNLKKLNLSNNKFVDIFQLGLEKLEFLKYLNLSNNKIENSLNQIGEFINKCVSLELLSISGNPCYSNDTNRIELLSKIPKLKEIDCKLRVLDTEITVNERVDAWKMFISVEDAEKMRSALALYLRSPPNVAPEDTMLLDMSGLDLIHLNFSPFSNLQKLCLRSNCLVTIEGLGLESLPYLTVLDLRMNDLRALVEVDRLILAHNKIRYIGLDGNEKIILNGKKEVSRINILGGLSCLMNSSCSLRYLDEHIIEPKELIKAFEPNIGSHNAEKLAFEVTLFRRLQQYQLMVYREKILKERKEHNIVDPEFDVVMHGPHESDMPLPAAEDVIELDLSDSSLLYLNLHHFPNIRKLNLDNNKFDFSALTNGHVSSLLQLESFSFQNNNITNIKTIGGFLEGFPNLFSVVTQNNNCFLRNDKETRQELLMVMPRSTRPNFPIKLLNFESITVRERIEAVEATSEFDENEIETMRLELSLEANVTSNNPAIIDLSNMNLKIISLISAKFTGIHTLILSNNMITTIKAQCLEQATLLKYLDLRNNKINSLDETVDALTKCHSLQTLYLFKSCGSLKETLTIDQYLPTVGERLRGIATIDDAPNPFVLNAEQKECQRFLWAIANIGPNQLHNVDLSNHHLPSAIFYFAIAALQELAIVTSLIANSNPWSEGPDRVVNYRQCLIFSLGAHLNQLDGEAIIGDELRNAYKEIEDDPKEQQKLYKNWKQCSKSANAAVAKFNARLTEHRRSTIARKSLGKGDRNQNYDAVPLIDVDEKDAEGADKGVGFWDVQVSDNSPNDAQLAEQVNSAWSGMTYITGSVLTKAEIIISFLQLYGLIFVIDINVQWPDIWDTVSSFVPFFRFDIDFALDYDINYKEEIKFGIIVLIPLLLMLFYWAVSSLKPEKWIEDYSNHWYSTKIKVFVIWLLLMILSFVAAVATDYPISFNQISSGTMPTTAVNGYILILWVFFTAIYFFWFLTVTYFRANYVGVERSDFLKWWLGNTYILRRMCLFIITILYMPASRYILIQFYCVNGKLDRYPNQQCFPNEWSYIQVISIFFGFLYILGIPAFFYYLIDVGVEVVSKQKYNIRKVEIEKEIVRLRGQMEKFKDTAWKAAEYEKSIKEYDEYLQTLWSTEVAKNPLPQTYLYSAYERQFRYYKILQMAQKLLVIIITLFVPVSWFTYIKPLAGTGVQGLFFIIAMAFRPFSDSFEDIMDIGSQFANTINLLAALGLSMGFLNDTISTIGLFIANCGAIALFIFNIFSTPLRLLWAEREALSRAAAIAAAAAEEAAESADKVIDMSNVPRVDDAEVQRAIASSVAGLNSVPIAKVEAYIPSSPLNGILSESLAIPGQIDTKSLASSANSVIDILKSVNIDININDEHLQLLESSAEVGAHHVEHAAIELGSVSSNAAESGLKAFDPLAHSVGEAVSNSAGVVNASIISSNINNDADQLLSNGIDATRNISSSVVSQISNAGDAGSNIFGSLSNADQIAFVAAASDVAITASISHNKDSDAALNEKFEK